jgi:hypothetical protein
MVAVVTKPYCMLFRSVILCPWLHTCISSCKRGHLERIMPSARRTTMTVKGHI